MEFTKRIQEIQHYLRQFIKGQDEAIKLISILLVNRERIDKIKATDIDIEYPKNELIPPNIMLVGPSGCGKTELTKRIAEVCNRFWFRVPCTIFSATGYVGKNTEDMLEYAINTALQQLIEKRRSEVVETQLNKLLLSILSRNQTTLSKTFIQKVYKWIETYKTDPSNPLLEEKISINLPTVQYDFQTKQPFTVNTLFNGTVKQAIDSLVEYAVMKDYDTLCQEAISMVENGIIVLDEIDKVVGGKVDNVSTYGVQRELLAIVEGSIFYTKYGPVNTKNILFVAAGAFQAVSPDEMLPELRGRFPVMIKLNQLNKEDFIEILKKSRLSPMKKYQAIMKADGITVTFTEEAIEYIAEIASYMNKHFEQIGARRLWELFDKHLIDLYLIDRDMTITKDMLQPMLEKVIVKPDNKQVYTKPIPNEMYV